MSIRKMSKLILGLLSLCNLQEGTAALEAIAKLSVHQPPSHTHTRSPTHTSRVSLKEQVDHRTSKQIQLTRPLRPLIPRSLNVEKRPTLRNKGLALSTPLTMRVIPSHDDLAEMLLGNNGLVRRFSTKAPLDSGLETLQLFKEGNSEKIKYVLTQQEDNEEVTLLSQRTVNYGEKIGYIDRIWGIFEDPAFQKFRDLLDSRDKTRDVTQRVPLPPGIQTDLTSLQEAHANLYGRFATLSDSTAHFPETLTKFGCLKDKVERAAHVREKLQKVKRKLEMAPSQVGSLQNQFNLIVKSIGEDHPAEKRNNSQNERVMTYSQELSDLIELIGALSNKISAEKKSLEFALTIPDESITKHKHEIQTRLDNIETALKNLQNLAATNETNKRKAAKLEQRFRNLKAMEHELELFLEHNKFNAIIQQKIEMVRGEIELLKKKLGNLKQDIKTSGEMFETLKEECIDALSKQNNIFDYATDPFYEVAGLRTVRILSIDGGGIRGVLPTRVLAEFEQKTGKPVAQLFDVITGTSVGGLIGLALNVPKTGGGLKNSAATLYENAKDDSRTIFPYQLSKLKAVIQGAWAKLCKRVFNYDTAFAKGDKGLYSRHGVKKITAKYLGDTLLKDSAAVVMISAVRRTMDKDQRYLHFFESNNPTHSQLSMHDVALATTAAPAIFGHHQIKDYFPSAPEGERAAKFVDGGLSANNPALFVYQHCVRVFEEQQLRYRYYIVSVGTGEHKDDKADVIDWTIQTIMGQGPANADEFLSKTFQSKRLGQYKRLQFKLGKQIALHDASEESFDCLKKVGEDYVQSDIGKANIDEIVKALKQDRPYSTQIRQDFPAI